MNHHQQEGPPLLVKMITNSPTGTWEKFAGFEFTPEGAAKDVRNMRWMITGTWPVFPPARAAMVQ